MQKVINVMILLTALIGALLIALKFDTACIAIVEHHTESLKHTDLIDLLHEIDDLSQALFVRGNFLG